MKRLLIAALLILVLAVPALGATVEIGFIGDPHLGYLDDAGERLAATQDARDWAVDTGGADFFLALGDIIEDPTDDIGEIAGVVEAIAGTIAGQTPKPFAIALGNHDIQGGVGDATRADWLTAIDDEGGTQTSFRQTFLIGANEKVRLIVLDMNYAKIGDEYYHYDTQSHSYTTDNNTYCPPDDLVWFEAQLVAAELAEEWVVVASHQLPYMLSEAYFSVRNTVDLRRIMEKYDCVVAYLNGHSHAQAVWGHGASPTDRRPVLFIRPSDVGHQAVAYAHAGVLSIDEDTGYVSVLGRDGIEAGNDVWTWNTKVWTNGGADGKFSTAANWDPAGAPVTRDLLILNATSVADATFDYDTDVVDGPSAIWIQSGYTGTLSFGAINSARHRIYGSVIVPVNATVACGAVATRGFHCTYLCNEGTISGTGRVVIEMKDPSFGFAEVGGTFTLGAGLQYYHTAKSKDFAFVNTKSIDIGSAPFKKYDSNWPATLQQEAAFVCGIVELAGEDGTKLFTLRVWPGGGAGLQTAAVQFGRSGEAFAGGLDLGPGEHILTAFFATSITMVGNAANHALTFGGHVQFCGNVTLAGITTDFGDAKIDSCGTITFNGTNATGTTSGNCIVTGRGGLVTFTAMQTNFTGRPILARRFTRDAGSVVAVQPAAPHWLTGMR